MTFDVYPYVAGCTTLAAPVQSGIVASLKPADILIASTPCQHAYEGKTLEEICGITGKPLEETLADLLAG